MNKDEIRSAPLSTATVDLVREQMAMNGFSSEDEVVRAALEALDRQTRDRSGDLGWIKARIKASVEDNRPGYSSEEMSLHLRQLFERAEQQRHDSAA